MRWTLDQFLSVFNSLAPSQRMAFAAVAVLIPAGFMFLAWNGGSSSMVPLSYGKVFAQDEMRNAEQALKEAGLSKFKSEGRQILAPAPEVEKYNAALLQSGSLPSHWAEELEKKLESTNPFMTSTETLRQTREALLGKHLRRMILATPDFEDADVFWTGASAARSRFGKEAKIKATVVVKPRSGRELSTRQIQSLRDAVTSAIPDLKATDVTIYDQRNLKSYTPDAENDPLGGKVLALLRESSQLYESRIKGALAHISPEIVVTVNVEIDPLQKSVTQSVKYDSKRSIDQQLVEQKRKEVFRQQPFQAEPGSKSNQPRALASAPSNTQDRTMQDDTTTTIRSPGGESTYTELVPTLPKLVTVSVLIPEDYYAKALEAYKAAPSTKGGAAKTIEKIKEETDLAVKNIVAGAIPKNTDSGATNVTVSSFLPIREEAIVIRTSTFDVVTSLLGQWGGAIGLGILALWAVWMLKGTAPRVVAAPVVIDASITVPTGAAAPTEAETLQSRIDDEPLPTLNDRDLVQHMVRENPEMAVAIIGKWLQAAR